MDELRHLINQKHELLARETFSRPALKRDADMSDEEKSRYIEYLADEVYKSNLEKEAMRLVLEDFLAKVSELDEKLSGQNEMISEMKKHQVCTEAELKKSKRKAADLESRLKYANLNRFGSKKQSVKKDKDDDITHSDRDKEKEEYNGEEETLSIKSVAENSDKTSSEVAEPSKKERDSSNRPESYKTMSIQGEPTKHPSDLSKVPGRILERKMVKVFRLEMNLIEEQFEMVHYVEPGGKPKWGYFPKEGHPQVVTKFVGTKATPEFLQAIAYEVYVKNVTFGLLHQWITDMGMTVSANTLRNWLKKGKKYLDQLILVLKNIALEKDSIVNCDETWCKVRKYDHYKKCYIWVLVNKTEQIVIFFYEDGSRGRDVLTNFLGDAELKSVMSDGYNAYVFIGDELKSTTLKNAEHQVCLAHVRARFVKASQQGGDKNADIFIKHISELYHLEHQYDEQRLTPEERGRRRQGLETKDILINLRANLIIERDKNPEEVTVYLTDAINYLYKFWDKTFAYIKDGNYPIDNNIAERSIRKLTTQRNSMFHFGSDEGAEMAAAYHSVISTVKLQNKSAWEYLGKFFTNIFNGCRDFLSLAPQNIGLADCQ